MNWALLCCTEKVLPLPGTQVTGQRQRRIQSIGTCTLLTRIALHRNLDAFYGNVLVFRVPKHGQRRARAQRCIVEIMGTGSRSLATFLDTKIAGKAISPDVDLMPHRRPLISNDSNGHDFISPRRTSNEWYVASSQRLILEITHASLRTRLT
jgi:hypothetical protein